MSGIFCVVEQILLWVLVKFDKLSYHCGQYNLLANTVHYFQKYTFNTDALPDYNL